MASALLNPYVIGFCIALLPAAGVAYFNYQSPADREKELERLGYRPSADSFVRDGVRQNGRTNALVLAAIFNNRHEPDLYTALGERRRRPPVDLQQPPAGAAGQTTATAAVSEPVRPAARSASAAV